MPKLRHLLVDSAAYIVNRAGGSRIVLPDGHATNVAFRCRHMASDYEAPFATQFVNHISPGMLVLDIGAHWGLYALMAARKARQVIAFEPCTQNLRLLRENVRLARVSNVEIRSEVVCGHVGETTFHEPTDRSWGNSMMGGVLPQSFTRAVSKQCTTVDASGVKPDLIKIDVEGAEASVLQGAAESIQRWRPILFIEVHHQRLLTLSSSPEQLRGLLESWGYEIEVVNQHEGAAGEVVTQWKCRSQA